MFIGERFKWKHREGYENHIYVLKSEDGDGLYFEYKTSESTIEFKIPKKEGFDYEMGIFKKELYSLDMRERKINRLLE